MSAYSSARSEPIGHGSCSAGKFAEHPGDEPRRLVGVVVHHLDHRRDVDGLVLLVPAVVVGHHGDGRVGDLRLARELRLGRAGHADDVGAARLVAERFGERGELRALHAEVGPAVLEGDALGLRRRDEAAAQQRRDRMRHRDMGDAAPCRRRSTGADRSGPRTGRSARTRRDRVRDGTSRRPRAR